MESPLTDHAQVLKVQLEALVRLQGIDTEMNLRRARVRALEAGIESSRKSLDRLQAELKEREAHLAAVAKDRREVERLVKERQEQVAKLSGQLYEVKTNDAYSTLQNEIKQKKQDNTAQEERILELMMAEDEARASLAQTAAAIKVAEAQVQAAEDEQRRDIGRIEQEIAGLQTQWDAAAKDVQPAHLDRYRRLLANKAGLAMAKIENDICTGCRIAIRPQAAIELRKYRALLFCDNCARILYSD